MRGGYSRQYRPAQRAQQALQAYSMPGFVLMASGVPSIFGHGQFVDALVLAGQDEGHLACGRCCGGDHWGGHGHLLRGSCGGHHWSGAAAVEGGEGGSWEGGAGGGHGHLGTLRAEGLGTPTHHTCESHRPACRQLSHCVSLAVCPPLCVPHCLSVPLTVCPSGSGNHHHHHRHS